MKIEGVYCTRTDLFRELQRKQDKMIVMRDELEKTIAEYDGLLATLNHDMITNNNGNALLEGCYDFDAVQTVNDCN